jgi:hypothetical protein
MSLRQLKGVDPEFLSLSRPSVQDAAKLPALRCRDQDSKSKEPVEALDVQPAQEEYKNSTPTHLPTGFPRDQVFSGSYAALRCQPGSPAVRALVLQQAIAVADLAFKNLLDTTYEQFTRSQILPPRQQLHGWVRKIITSSGTLQTDMSHFSNRKPSVPRDTGGKQGEKQGAPPAIPASTCCIRCARSLTSASCIVEVVHSCRYTQEDA